MQRAHEGPESRGDPPATPEVQEWTALQRSLRRYSGAVVDYTLTPPADLEASECRQRKRARAVRRWMNEGLVYSEGLLCGDTETLRKRVKLEDGAEACSDFPSRHIPRESSAFSPFLDSPVTSSALQVSGLTATRFSIPKGQQLGPLVSQHSRVFGVVLTCHRKSLPRVVTGSHSWVVAQSDCFCVAPGDSLQVLNGPRGTAEVLLLTL